jgi:hypothetical protein
MSPAPLALLVCALLATASAAAQGTAAQPVEKGALLPLRVEAHAAFTWDAGFGAGARAEISLLGKGRLYDNAHDELALSLGADVTFINFTGSDQVDIWPTALVQWSLGIGERGVFYPELGLAAHIRPDGWGGIYPNIGFGGRYYLHRSVALLGRLGWPMALSLGIAF